MALDLNSLTAPAGDVTPREWLASQADSEGNPLAKAGTRGRFGKDAVAALEHAKAQGWTFTEPVKAAPSAPAAPRVTAPRPAAAPAAAPAPVETLPQVDPKEVRAWAKQNGHEVAQRGRLHKTVVQAFLKAGGKPVGQGAKRVTPLDMPKVRRETTGFVMIGNTRIRQDMCGACKASVSRCACKVGPSSFPLDGNVYPLSLDKPSL